MRAEIVSVGTELLLGHITDTNASWLAQQLSQLGIDNYYVSAIGDNLGRLTEHLQRAWERSELIVITGGVGPTEDDLTREAISALLGEPMVVQPDLEVALRAFFARRGVSMPESNVKQATLIASARVLENPVGTAPGWWVERDGRVIVAMPGVPGEMFRMWEHQVVPRLRQRQGGSVILTRTFKVVSLGKSAVEELIKPLLAQTNPTIATYAKADGVHVRTSAKAESVEAAEALLDGLEPRVREALGRAIYGLDADSLATVDAALLERLGLTLATGEEFTGGLIAGDLSEAAGAHFKGGLVSGDAPAEVPPEQARGAGGEPGEPGGPSRRADQRGRGPGGPASWPSPRRASSGPTWGWGSPRTWCSGRGRRRGGCPTWCCWTAPGTSWRSSGAWTPPPPPSSAGGRCSPP